MATEIYVDSAVRFSVTVKNASDTLIDPTTLKIEITSPQGSVTTYIYGTDAELVKDSTGTYHADYTIPGPGWMWTWKWIATGTGAGADKGTLKVLS